MLFKYFLESSLNDLFKSAVEAFPDTSKRQHAIDPLIIKKLYWTPYLGMKTLFVKGLIESENKEYNPMILFKKVKYTENKGGVEIVTSEEKSYFFEPLSTDKDVVLRCNCNDFKWRFSYYNHLDKSLYGRKSAKYESKGIDPSANPNEAPGMCKHLMKMVKVIKNMDILG